MIYKMLGAFLSISLCSSSLLAQQSFTIKGVVINSNTMEPVTEVNIKGENLFAISSFNGEFFISNISKGRYHLKISHIGYITEYMTIEVDRNIDNIVIKLKESVTNLEEVQVLGKTKNQKAKELPVITYEVSKGFLNQNRENSLMQTLQKIPGVSTINIGSGQSKPLIRGLGFNRVSVVQNGVKHEAQQWGADHGLEIDQYDIENIQIIKGPASLLFGSDAVAGVVDIQSPEIPQPHSFQGEVNLLGETNNNLLGVSAGVTGRKDKWFYRGRLTFRDYGDYKVPTDKINYENYIFELHENHLRNTAGTEANSAFSLGFLSGKVKSETFISNVYARNGFFANAHGLEVRSSNIDYDRSDRDIDLPFHEVNHFKIINNTSVYQDKHTLHLDFGYQHNHREEHSEPAPHGYMPNPPDTKEREFIKNTWSLNTKNTRKINDNQEVVFGLNAEFQDNQIGGWGFLIPEYTRFTAGVFVYDHFKIKEKIHLQGGLRYDFGVIDTKAYYDWYPSTVNNSDGSTSYIYLQRAQNKNLNFNNISGSVGISYIRDKITYKLNIGKSFRIPLANELASDGVNYHMYRYEKGNLNLKPEESYQIDIDLDYSTKNFSFGINPFVNLFENFIYLNPTPDYYETLQIYEYTQSKVLRVGGELKFGYALTENLRIDASAEYVYSRQRSGPKKNFTLPFSPPLSGLVSANYQFKKDLFCFKNIRVIADYRLTEKQDEIVPPEEKTEGYQVLNLAFLSSINLFNSEKQTGLRFKLNNVFNTKYFNHTSFYRLIDVPEAGRNISLSLTIPF
ncbi:TonB-dependent receptor [Abyssalbus ytuae]|uniref:TonB-dependent receptor n=1 Tax=Abyssalbus ytuae TaxID=2926907 RepID=A0A9E7D1U3_9FLAO|nr:TonB-dependent receptor [Abyssalbus ytuae]UOB17468.1 TonB-dependent receptor [Abyssalbus ytuae]